MLEAVTKKAELLLEELKERTIGLNRERESTQVHVLYNQDITMLIISQMPLRDQLTSLAEGHRWSLHVPSSRLPGDMIYMLEGLKKVVVELGQVLLRIVVACSVHVQCMGVWVWY